MTGAVGIRYVGPPGQVCREVSPRPLLPGVVYVLEPARAYLLAATSRHFELADGERDEPKEL